MKKLRTFDINLPGLRVGKHIFTYEIDKSFFENFEDSPVSKGDVYVHLTLEKRERMLLLDFFIDGSLVSECDRCLDEFNLPVNSLEKVIYKYEGEESTEDLDDPNILFIDEKTERINVAQLIYEFALLQIPIKKTCEMDRMGEKKCNPKMLEYLQNKEDEKEIIDPRWEKLKNIKNN